MLSMSLLTPPPGVEPGEGFFQPVGSFPARDAPAAAFMLVELHGAQSEFDHADLVSSSTTTPPEPSMLPALATWSKSMPISISVGNKTGVDEPPGTTAFNDRLPSDAATHFINHLLEVVAHGQFVHARGGQRCRSGRTGVCRHSALSQSSRTPHRRCEKCGEPWPEFPRY